MNFEKILFKVSNILIIVSLILFTLETLPEASNYARWFLISEIIIVAVFTVEYIYLGVRRGKKYITSLAGFIDLAAILPTYLSFGMIDLKFIRILRLLRLFRIFKLHRMTKASDRLYDALKSIRHELAIFSMLTIVLVYLSSVGIYYFERDAQPDAFKSVFHSMWWAVATLTTVGYGDVYPVTTGGKIFTFFILIIGLSIISIPSGLLASALTETAKKKSDHEEEE